MRVMYMCIPTHYNSNPGLKAYIMRYSSKYEKC